MKNRFLSLAGALALAAVLGKVYAVPAIAQTVRALLVKNVDEKGRSPYQEFAAHTCENRVAACDVVFPVVPAGKRLVLERVNSNIAFANGGILGMGVLYGVGDRIFYVNPQVVTVDHHFVNEPALLYFESGQTPTLRVILNNPADFPVVISTLSGYLVDLTQ